MPRVCIVGCETTGGRSSNKENVYDQIPLWTHDIRTATAALQSDQCFPHFWTFMQQPGFGIFEAMLENITADISCIHENWSEHTGLMNTHRIPLKLFVIYGEWVVGHVTPAQISTQMHFGVLFLFWSSCMCSPFWFHSCLHWFYSSFLSEPFFLPLLFRFPSILPLISAHFKTHDHGYALFFVFFPACLCVYPCLKFRQWYLNCPP